MNVQTILVPVDFSTCSMLVTRQAAGLAAGLGAQLVLLHVGELPSGLPPSVLVRPDGEGVTVAGHLHDSGMEHLGPYVEAARGLGVEARAVVTIGEVVPSIVRTARDEHADLIAMGTHGRSGLARVVLGSVAERVVRDSEVPVLLVRRQRRPDCAYASCNWCTEGARSVEEERVQVELDG